MRIVQPPPPKPETVIECKQCNAVLAYTDDDCFWLNGNFADLKVIYCPYCKKEIVVDKVPYPIIAGDKTFFFN